MKYIIELEDEPYMREDGVNYYTCKSARWYKLGETIINRLTPYTEPDLNPLVDEAVETIENEVWEFASSIICPSDCGIKDSIHKDCKEIFGLDSWELRGIFTNYSYQEAKAKHEAWLKQKEEIRVGDEVTIEMAFGNGLDNNMKAVALDQTATGEEWCVLTENGCVETHDEEDLYKTGRHFPEVAELLKKMRGDKE